MFHALFIASFVFASIGPALYTPAVLKIILPLSLIAGTIHVNVNAVAISLVIFPVTLIDIAISVPEFALAVCLIDFPFSLILGSIRPDLSARAMAHSILQVAYHF